MGYKSKNITAVVNIFGVEADRTFLKVYDKDLVKVTRFGEVIYRKRRPTLRKLSFKFQIEARCLNYAIN